jgi:hypothetical protein
MALPKLKQPTYELKIPSTGKMEAFRPFVVREEKILLMAKSSQDPTDIFRSIKQVVNNCAIDDNFDVDKLTIFDMEYLFLRIRGFSVNNIVDVSYRDNEDQKIYNFKIDLNKIEVQFPSGVNKTIKIGKDVGMTMKYPSASIFDDKEYFKTGEDSFYELIIRCVDKIFDGDDVYDPRDYTKEEIEEFLEQVNVNTFQDIVKFMESTPKLYHKIEYKNANGNDRVIELTTLTDFFTLG